MTVVPYSGRALASGHSTARCKGLLTQGRNAEAWCGTGRSTTRHALFNDFVKPLPMHHSVLDRQHAVRMSVDALIMQYVYAVHMIMNSAWHVRA
jgi:hypothetical protein